MASQPPDPRVDISERTFIRLVSAFGKTNRETRRLSKDVAGLRKDVGDLREKLDNENLKALVNHAGEILAQTTPSPQLAELADYAKAHADELTEFLKSAPAFVEQLQKAQRDREAFRRILRGYLRVVTVPGGWLSKLFLAVIGAIAAVILEHLLTHTPPPTPPIHHP